VNHLTREDVKKQTCCNPLGVGQISARGLQAFEMAKGGEEHVGETLSIGGTHKRNDIHALCNKSKRTRMRPIVEGPSHLLLKNSEFWGGLLGSCNQVLYETMEQYTFLYYVLWCQFP
jgi:hypothetical protein